MDEAFQEFIEEKPPGFRLGRTSSLYHSLSYQIFYSPGLGEGSLLPILLLLFLEEYLEPWSINPWPGRNHCSRIWPLSSYRKRTPERKAIYEENLKGEIRAFPSEVNFHTIRLRQGKELFLLLEERGYW